MNTERLSNRKHLRNIPQYRHTGRRAIETQKIHRTRGSTLIRLPIPTKSPGNLHRPPPRSSIVHSYVETGRIPGEAREPKTRSRPTSRSTKPLGANRISSRGPFRRSRSSLITDVLVDYPTVPQNTLYREIEGDVGRRPPDADRQISQVQLRDLSGRRSAAVSARDRDRPREPGESRDYRRAAPPPHSCSPHPLHPPPLPLRPAARDLEYDERRWCTVLD